VNWGIKSKNSIKSLLVVAHPDDETIFCGGTMLYFPKWKWQVVYMTKGNGNAPNEEFEKAMLAFKKNGVDITSYKSLGQEKLKKGASEEEKTTLESKWKEALDKQGFSPDIIFTHNEKGEYGHEDHKLLNKVVREYSSNVWEFICPGASNCSQPYKERIKVVPLTGEILKTKTSIFNNNYTSQLYNWRGDLNRVFWYEFKTGPEIFTSEGSN
jgi:hypothetical protein